MAALHNEVINLQLASSPLDDLLFNGLLGNKSVDNDLPLLADSVRPVNGLQVHLGIPVRVEKYHDVGLVEVDADAASSGREDEDLFLALRVLKVINPEIALVSWSLPIDSAVFVATNPKHVVENVHQLGHLAEDEDLAVLADELGDEVIQYFEFHGGVDDVIAVDEGRTGLHVFEEVGVIAHFFELHKDI